MKKKTDRLLLTMPKNSTKLDANLFDSISRQSFRTKKILSILSDFSEDYTSPNYTADRIHKEQILPILLESEAKTSAEFKDVPCPCSFVIKPSNKFTSGFSLIYRKLKLSGKSTRIVLDTIKAFSIVHNADVLDIDGLYAIAMGGKEQGVVHKPQPVSDPVPIADEKAIITEKRRQKLEQQSIDMFNKKYSEFENLKKAHGDSLGVFEKLRSNKQIIVSADERAIGEAVLRGENARVKFYYGLKQNNLEMHKEAFTNINSAIKTLNEYI